jgi:hypothetical protein
MKDHDDYEQRTTVWKEPLPRFVLLGAQHLLTLNHF